MKHRVEVYSGESNADGSAKPPLEVIERDLTPDEFKAVQQGQFEATEENGKMHRVFEEVLNLLVARGAIDFSKLSVEAQERLARRKAIRADTLP